MARPTKLPRAEVQDRGGRWLLVCKLIQAQALICQVLILGAYGLLSDPPEEGK